MTKLLVLDTETTGIGSADEPIEVALALYKVDQDGNAVEKIDGYSGRRQPSVPISPMAQKVHGLSISNLIGMDFDHEKVRSLIASADIIVAHNADFDARMLEVLYPEIKNKSWRCTLNQWPWPPSASRSLSSIAADLDISGYKAHSAEGDVDALSASLFHPVGHGAYVMRLLQAGDFVFRNVNQGAFKRAASSVTSDLSHACKSLLHVIGAIISDKHLHDSEINFIYSWIKDHPSVSSAWPGNVITQQLDQILFDGLVSEDERSFLLNSLSEITAGSLQKVSDVVEKVDFQLDDPSLIEFSSHTFCLSGNFLFGDKDRCIDEIIKRGGVVLGGVTKKLNYLIVGSLGSDQWKHGNFGTKVEKAIQYRSDGIPIKIVHEEAWTKFL